MKQALAIISMLCIMCSSGCKTVATKKQQVRDIKATVETVAEGLSGQELSQEEVDALTHDIMTDEQTQSAIQAIADSYTEPSVNVKYCPIDGQRYSSSIERCPVHGVQLKPVE